MKNVFDITDFGAVGDGSFDCTESVQAALDAAAGCSGKVVVPPGTYMVGGLKMRGKGVSLEGSPAWSFRNDGASVFILNSDASDCMLDIGIAPMEEGRRILRQLMTAVLEISAETVCILNTLGVFLCDIL